MGMDLKKEMRKMSEGLSRKLFEALEESQAADLDDVNRVLTRQCMQLFGDDFDGFEVRVSACRHEPGRLDFKIIEKPMFKISGKIEF